MKKLTKFAIAAVLLPLSFAVSAENLNFDDISLPTSPNHQKITSYHDFTWTDASVLNYEYYGKNQSGYKNGTISGTNTLFNFAERDMSIEKTGGGTFDLVSAWMTGAWRNNLSVTVTGFLNGQVVNTMDLTLSAINPTEVLFNFTGIDKVTFSSTKVTGDTVPGFINKGWQMAIDDMVITPVSAVPEPSTYAMMFAGLGLLGLMVRRRKAD